jgi:hypothetical protein
MGLTRRLLLVLRTRRGRPPVLRARSYDEDGIEGIDDRKAQFVAGKARALNRRVGGGLE